MVKISDHIRSATLNAIDIAIEAAQTPYLPQRLGPSDTATACERALWYKFRWAFDRPPFEARMLRLFETGRLEEERMLEWLRLVGVDVQTTGEDYRAISISACDGHFLGLVDGIATGVKEAPKARHVVECKTHNRKSFDQLKKHGLKIARPEHFAQMQIYMNLLEVERGLYLAKCKDDDDLYLERIEMDFIAAGKMIEKFQRVIMSSSVPARISEDPESYACRFCDFRDNCYSSDVSTLPRRNCRTCLHSGPMPEGKWFCFFHDKELTFQDQKEGCSIHLYLPDLVNGTVDEADDEKNTVTYIMNDGTSWTDGARRED